MEKIKKSNSIKKILALTLVFVMALTMMPAMAWADEGAVSVTFTYSKDNTIVYGPVSLDVQAGQAAAYGIGEVSSQPTVLDAVVAAHVARYGEDFKNDNSGDYLNDGMSKIFGDNGYAGHILNSHYSSDYASQAVLHNGDNVDTFMYSNSYEDYYATFYQDEQIVREIETVVGEEVSLKVKGFGIMNAYLGEAWNPLIGLNVGAVDSQGASADIQSVTDKNGDISVSFDKMGTYILTTYGTAGSTPIVPAWCKVIVQKGLSEEEQQAAVSSDKDNLNIQYINGNFVDLPKKGTSEKTRITWSSDKPEVISTSGSIVKQLEETIVTLTANIICGNVQDTKVFPITVPAMNETEIEERIAVAKAELTKVDIMNPVQYSGGSGGMYSFESEVQDINLVEKAQVIVSKVAPGVAVSLESVNSGQEYIAGNGMITYPSGYSKGNAEVSFNLQLGNKTENVSVGGIVIPTYDASKSEAVKTEMDKLTLDQVLNGQDQSNVTSTMKLPVGSSFGLGITWTSNNSAITINKGTSSSTGQLHTVTRPTYGQNDAIVTLTATIDYSDMAKQYGLCDGGPMPSNNTKSFTVTVPAITAEEADNIKIEVEEAVDSVIATGITVYEPGTDVDTKVAADLEKITYDLHLYDFDRTSDFWKDGVRLSWSSTNPAITVNTLRAKISRPDGKTDAKGKLIVTATKEGISASKAFDTVVLATGIQPEVDPAVNEAIKNITDGYAAKSTEWWGSSNATWWVATAMGAERKYSNTEKLSSEQKQAYANQMIGQVALALESVGSADSSEATTANQLSNAINGLSAMGYDIEKITTINSTSIKAGTSLKNINLDGAKKGYFSTRAPYVILAANQGNYGTANLSDGLIEYLLSIQLESGGWGYGTTTDIDTTAMVMQGLAVSNKLEAIAACEQGLEVLASRFAECEENTFGNANTDAMVIIALAEMGINPDADARFVKNGKSLLDGLVGYLNESKTAFTYYGRENDMATSQGVLGLIAAKTVTENEAPVNVFDFSGMAKEAVKATGVGPVEPQDPPSQGEDLNVTVSIQSNSGYWLVNKSVTVKKGSNVGHVLIKAIEGTDITQIGAANGYVSSISKGEITLSEFTLGPNSGWLYKVNGVLPNISITSYDAMDGDSILFYYTIDWTKDPDASKYPGAPTDQSNVTTSGTAGSATTTTPTEVTVSGDIAKATIKTENATEAIKQAKENKSAEIVIEVANSDIKTAEKVQVEIPTATAKEILNTTTADLTVKTPAGTVTIPHDALKEAVAEAKGTTITVEVAAVSKPTDIQKNAAGTNGQIISVTIKSGSTVISTFGGKSLKIKTEVPTKLKGKSLAAIHIADDGTIEQLAGKLVKEGTKEYYEFMTSHLSTFALVDAEELGLEAGDEDANIERIKELVSDMSLKASSSKTSKKNIKVTLTVDKSTAASIKEIKEMGYTVKYKYYRSTKKASKYQAKITKTTRSFTNTAGKKGTKYYYKARIQVYDKDGNLVAQTALKQCRYAARTWTK